MSERSAFFAVCPIVKLRMANATVFYFYFYGIVIHNGFGDLLDDASLGGDGNNRFHDGSSSLSVVGYEKRDPTEAQ
jgi:hypothetical protein